ncbi:LPXTG cell wall anchor domain-containing protein [Streptococcus parasanguinis]|nr:LPXTG cell wall anchor domain-containing protein [Streptococcus parasanguinis]MCY7050949.1 LPXTG cell wall anchor domain-containing protein [Streptococcus parasanguinis]MDB8626186.1 LPXTG cell wall anchor domain-containing protein [Streptococcus parasanguinis]
MSTPTTPVTPSKVQPEVATLSQAEDKKEKPVLFQQKTPEAVSVSTSDHPEKEGVKSPSLQSEGKLPQTGTKEGGFFAWLGLLGLGFLGGGAKFARRKE